MSATLFGFSFLQAFHNPFRDALIMQSVCKSAVGLLMTKPMTSNKPVMGCTPVTNKVAAAKHTVRSKL